MASSFSKPAVPLLAKALDERPTGANRAPQSLGSQFLDPPIVGLLRPPLLSRCHRASWSYLPAEEQPGGGARQCDADVDVGSQQQLAHDAACPTPEPLHGFRAQEGGEQAGDEDAEGAAVREIHACIVSTRWSAQAEDRLDSVAARAEQLERTERGVASAGGGQMKPWFRPPTAVSGKREPCTGPRRCSSSSGTQASYSLHHSYLLLSQLH